VLCLGQGIDRSSTFDVLRELLVEFGVGFEHDASKALLLPCYLQDELDPIVRYKRWPHECPQDQQELLLHVNFLLFQPAGLMEQLVVACVAHMKDMALSKSCVYMEAKHTGDKLLLEQVPSGDATIKNVIRITMRRKANSGQVLHSVLEALRKLITAYSIVPHSIEINLGGELGWQLWGHPTCES